MAWIQAYIIKAVYIPTIWEDAMACSDTKYKQADLKSELKSIIDQSILSKSVKIPERHNIIRVKVVWDIKYIEDSSIVRYKAYWVTCGFTQVYTVRHEETFTLTICNDTLCIFCTIAAKNS